MDNIAGHDDTIISGLMDGSVSVESLEELRQLLNGVQDNPAAIRAIGDGFVTMGAFDDAVAAYKKAIVLFIKSDNILPAIAAKILEWDLVKASERDCRDIYTALHEINTESIPVYDCLARMAYGELMAVMEEMEVVAFPPGTTIREMGDAEEDLNFVVRGVLQEKRNVSMNDVEGTVRMETENLHEDNFFGDVYPFDDVRFSQTVIDAITSVEVLRIRRSDLMEVIRKHPAVEFLIMELCRHLTGAEGKKSLQVLRASKRFQLQTKVTMKIFPDHAGDSPLVINGFTEDLSAGGTCVRLGEAYWTGSSSLIGKTVKLLINVPKLSTGIDVLGTIAWRREVEQHERKTILIGIQFKEMSHDNFEFLKKHCYVGDGEQDMIFSLWESYVKK
ncbi:MAG: PilZ domain-containing protein [Deltaproteobacteria bacterium]|nr:PilZ domain-containing protein [Deltaproteobacteria bacterium]MBN2688058.1 PilZ domain-containing protein [Deltaproteobacteria bacterium]